MIFDLEDEGSERSFSDKPMLPLLEAAPPPALRPRVSRSSSGGLPASLSALRPASLPAPSHIRPPRGQHGSDISYQSMRLPQAPAKSPKAEEAPLPPPDSREAEILKLVAANTPSHRGAWKRDSKAWQTFVRRQDEKLDNLTDPLIPEEGDDIMVGLNANSDEETDSDEFGGEHNPLYSFPP